MTPVYRVAILVSAIWLVTIPLVPGWAGAAVA